MDAEEETVPQERRQLKYLEKMKPVIIKLLDSLQRTRGVFFALGIAITSTALNILSFIAGERMHPTNVTLWTSVTMTSLSVIAIILTRPTFQHSLKTVSYLALGSLFIGCGSVSLLVGIIMSEPANAVSLFFTLPVILIILEAIIKKQKTKLLHLIFTVSSIIGVVFVVKPSFLFSQSSGTYTWGVLCGLLSAFAHAGTFITFRELADSCIHPFVQSISTSVSMLVISFSLSILLKSVTIPSDVNMLLVISAAGVSHFGAYNFVFLAIASERPFIVSIIMTFEVLFTFVAQWLFLNIALSWYSAIGGCLISVACIGVALTKDKHDNENDEPEEEQLLHE